ncbi:MAG: tagatose 1,6-diphosphate aldolase [Armatimonadetes bacterium]|nr:tagatose 1,6-diphosphate aldolase [Armatimonadota bacterium]
MAREISVGKMRGLMRLADPNGRFKMMAIDQRGSLNKALAGVLGREATHDEVARFKQIITRHLGRHASAVLTDPLYGMPRSGRDLPAQAGLLLAYEKTGYVTEEGGKGRNTELIEGWSVAKAVRAGADAIKLLLYYQPEAEPKAVAHQQAICRQVGEECARHDVPFLLEPMSYAVKESGTDTPEFARKKPEVVIETAREFSRPEYGVDVLKMEFPADLKYTHEYCNGVFDPKVRTPVYSLAEVRRICAQLNEAARVPWVILSAAVNIEEFLANVDLACAAGASGFLCGRAIWKEAIPRFTNPPEMERFLDTTGRINFLKCNAAAEAARPMWEHPALAGATVALDTEDWHREYPAP